MIQGTSIILCGGSGKQQGMDCRAALAMTAPFHHLAAMVLAFVIQQLLPNLA